MSPAPSQNLPRMSAPPRPTRTSAVPRPRHAGLVERAWGSVAALGYGRERRHAGPVNDAVDIDGQVYTELGNKAAEGAGIGGAIGGSLAAIAAAVAAVGTTITFPGIGLVVAGPMAAAIAGAGIGAVTGGIVGALIGWGIPEERVRLGEPAPLGEPGAGAEADVRTPG